MNDLPSPSPVARALAAGGFVIVAVGFGIGLGYWASEWEIQFFPTIVAAILLFWVTGLLVFAAGAHVGRSLSLRLVAVIGSLLALGVAGLVGVALGIRSTPLTAMAGADLKRAHEIDARYLRDLVLTLDELVARVESHQELFGAESPRVPTEEEESFLLDAWVAYLDTAMALDQLRQFHEDFYRFDLSRLERPHHVKSFLLSFVSELALFESTARLVALLDTNENAERFLNVARPELGLARDSVARVREELSGLTDLARVSAGKRYLSFLETVHQARTDAGGESLSWLWDEAEHFVALAESRRRRDAVALSLASDFAPIRRGLKRVTFPVQREVAEWMGDTRVKRAGGHYLVSAEQARDLERELEPGDVLLSRKNWYLSNVGLPGFWPHAILYVGASETLGDVFDSDPSVRDWIERASGGPLTLSEYLEKTYPIAWRRRTYAPAEDAPLSVIEAVSEGVIQNSVHGASGDFIVALRPRTSPLARAQAIFRAFDFLDRPYDFDFDFATDHALVCTEVVWRAYRVGDETAGLGLEPVPVAGRLTLPANEIARTFRREYELPERRFDFVYYLEGREREERAVVSDVTAFLETADRSKWDFGK